MEILQMAIFKFIGNAIQNGFVLPYYVISIGANGTLLAFEMRLNERLGSSGGLSPTLFAERMMGGGIRPPINVLLTDPAGRAARMLIEGLEKEPEFFW
ncbi:MAG: hypothetical protein J2P21_02595 [Chloracidobacterium sp.]|nr:hypothetical protein [Chloracidobacterium sp.]